MWNGYLAYISTQTSWYAVAVHDWITIDGEKDDFHDHRMQLCKVEANHNMLAGTASTVIPSKWRGLRFDPK